MIKHYRYDVIGASLDYGISEHPQSDMKNLGFEVVKSEPVPIADCWWFRVKEIPDEIPGYIYKMSDNFKFSDEYELNDDGRLQETGTREPPMYKADGSLTDYGKYRNGSTDFPDTSIASTRDQIS